MSTGSVQRLLRSSLHYARLRLQLLELELDQERARLGGMLARGITLALTALIGVQLLAVLLVSLSWETSWRLHVIVGLMLTAAGAALISWRSLQRLRRSTPQRTISSLLDDIDLDATPPTTPPPPTTPQEELTR